jgi:Ni/Co efflux regulator RcnB
MHRLSKFLVFSTVALTLSTGSMFAQHDDHHDDHDNHGYVQHKEWKKGYHMNHDDWGRGQPVDYRQYHLAQPRPGYEWRQVDGNYVMAAVATGVIASVIVASAAH